jgi:hypothetical protein
MAKPLRSPKDEADQPKHTIGWLQRIFRFLVEWKDETCNYTNKLDRIIMNQAELATGLKAIQTQVGKVAAEQAAKSDALIAKVAELEAIIAAGGDVTPEVTEALEGVKTALQALDDVIPDAPPTP